MRIKITFTQNTESVPNNQKIVNSYIHKCIGVNNEYHNTMSNYCVSQLMGGTVSDGGKSVEYSKGSFLIITSENMEFINRIIMGVISNPIFGYGMKFKSIEHIEEKFYNGWNYFRTTPMGFIIKKMGSTNRQIGWINDNLNEEIKNHIIRKMSKVKPGISCDGLEVNVTDNKIKRRYVKNVNNQANICGISIYANKELAEAIYNYGIGQSTGSGFGTVYTTKYRNLYI